VVVSSVAGAEIDALYTDGSRRSFDLKSASKPVTYISSASAAPPIPPYCRSSLVEECLQAEANSTTLYAPMKNSATVVRLTRGVSARIQKGDISIPCVLNDFVTLPNYLLSSCCDSETHNYCVDDDPDGCHTIQLFPGLNHNVTPIVYRGIYNGIVVGVFIGISNIRELVTFIEDESERRTRPLLPDNCTVPVSLSRQGSTVLLTCANDTQFLVNIADNDVQRIFFQQVDSNNGLLLALSKHGFAVFLSVAGSHVTLQSITSGVAWTVPIENNNYSVFADFTSDGRYAFVAVNSTAVMFIYVTEAIATDSNSQYFHTISTTQPLCPTCPAVQFLTTTIAVISSYNMQAQTTTISVLLLTQWPPCVLQKRTLNGGQPRQYWLNQLQSAPPVRCDEVSPATATSVPVSFTPSPSSSSISLSPTPSIITTNSNSNGLSSGAIAGISASIAVVAVIGFIVLIIFLTVFVIHKCCPGNGNNGREPVPAQGHGPGEAAYACNNGFGNAEIRDPSNAR